MQENSPFWPFGKNPPSGSKHFLPQAPQLFTSVLRFVLQRPGLSRQVAYGAGHSYEMHIGVSAAGGAASGAVKDGGGGPASPPGSKPRIRRSSFEVAQPMAIATRADEKIMSRARRARALVERFE